MVKLYTLFVCSKWLYCIHCLYAVNGYIVYTVCVQ